MNLITTLAHPRVAWVPACAGMTVEIVETGSPTLGVTPT